MKPGMRSSFFAAALNERGRADSSSATHSPLLTDRVWFMKHARPAKKLCKPVKTDSSESSRPSAWQSGLSLRLTQ